MPKDLLPTKVISASRKAVRPFFARAMSFDKFYKSLVVEMSPKQRAVIVEQAILLLEGFYVHLPLKCAMYAIDPLRRLRLLRHQLEQPEAPASRSDQYFHREMMQIFASLRDQHTVYNLPQPYDEYHAWLPFKVEACYVGDRRKYLVTRVVDGFGQIRKGAEIQSWNGVPIERALETMERQMMAGNAAARRALALLHLTVRPLRTLPPPEEEWVGVGYRTAKGQQREIWIRWVVSDLPTYFEESDPKMLKIAALRVQQVRKLLFAPEIVELQRRLSKARDPYSLVKRAQAGVPSIFPSVFAARSISNSRGRFGYIRIFSFEGPEPDRFIKEFIRLASALPQTGLIIDVRDNPGGKTASAERLVQLISPVQPVEPQVFYFINTGLTLQLCKLLRSGQSANSSARTLGPLKRWIDSITRAMETGATYSSSFPVSDLELRKDTGRMYPGPVIVVTNALSYSAAEMFAAGFQDHGGKIIGTDESTGGGGANVRTHEEMRTYFKEAANSPFKRLPMGASMTIALRRSQRVGLRSGGEIEDFGVTPDYSYAMTPDDLLNKNCDLIDYATKLLKELKERPRAGPQRR
jgi:C-terminal processing protease CtpA/Prc